VFGGIAVVAEFFAELDDDLIESPGRAVIIVTPNVVEEAVAGEDLAGMGVEELEQFQFSWGEGFGGFAALELKGFRIDARNPDLERVVVFGVGRALAGSAQQSVNAGEQFAEAEGFGDVIIRAEIEADDFINFLPFGGEHQDRGGDFFGAELFANVVAAEAREHDIEHDKGRFLFGDGVDGFVAAIADGDVKAVAAQNLFEAEEDVRIVFDDEDFGFGGHTVKSVVGSGWLQW